MSGFAPELKAWAEVWYYGIVPLVALVPIMDHLLGISPRLARLLHIKKPDFILLALTMMFGAALVIALKPITDTICWGICDYVIGRGPISPSPEELIARQRHFEAEAKYYQLRIQLLPVVHYLNLADLLLVLLCPFICLGLAVRQKRPVIMWPVWFAMGICGTFGSVFWLIAEKRKMARRGRA